ncbi:response regulator transcription factor [Vagococcus carniphilus]|uniref:response regulator transcription factor n=1 Tax=Vagococcus carniphilus TaxID=218144 RepID=UPI003BAD5CB8
MKILYIEDEKEINEWLRAELTKAHYEVYAFKSYHEFKEYHSEEITFDLAILDVMLPGLDGFSIARRLKKEQTNLPIIMLTARSQLEDKLEGLSIADDYITKPFQVEEILARMQVLLRRFEKDEEVISVKHLEINLKNKTIINTNNTQEILLTQKQYALLNYFIVHGNQILTKEQLYEAVWNEDYIDGDKTLMVHIRYLREKIEEDPSHPEIVETIRGIGYRVRL